MKQSLFAAGLFAVANGLICPVHADLKDDLKKIVLPPGFQIEIFADDVPNARGLARGENGTVFVGTRTKGDVYALVDEDGDYRADKRHTIFAEGELPDGSEILQPTGVAFRDGSLYVGAISHILRWDNIEKNLSKPGAPVIVTSAYPDKQHHGWKYIAFGPDGKLYVPVGAWCNVCDDPDEVFASITRINADGSGREVVAKGVRNTVGFDWHPETKELWFTDNGRDGMGDDMPADELGRVEKAGQHFGFPYIHQGDTPDPQFGAGHSPGEFTKPAINLGPHVAAVGMKFYTGAMFPAEYKGQILIAEHGSWNRSKKLGYRITMVTLKGSEAETYTTFAEGWLQDGKFWGRPVDLLLLPDGSMLVSDDVANAVYRISYKP